jgi:hypothetical protein
MAVRVKHKAAQAHWDKDWEYADDAEIKIGMTTAVTLAFRIPYAEGHKDVEVDIDYESFANIINCMVRVQPESAIAGFSSALISAVNRR